MLPSSVATTTPSGRYSPHGIHDRPSRLATTNRGSPPSRWNTAHAHSHTTPNAGSFNAATNASAAAHSGVPDSPTPVVCDPILMAFRTAFPAPRFITLGGGDAGGA